MILEKANELVDTVKQTAHDTSVKVQEFEKKTEEKFIEAEKIGNIKVQLYSFFI